MYRLLLSSTSPAYLSNQPYFFSLQATHLLCYMNMQIQLVSPYNKQYFTDVINRTKQIISSIYSTSQSFSFHPSVLSILPCSTLVLISLFLKAVKHDEVLLLKVPETVMYNTTTLVNGTWSGNFRLLLIHGEHKTMD